MAEFRLDRLKYNWKGEWAPAQTYQRDDVVGLNGKSYVCLQEHTSDSVFSNDLNAVVAGSEPLEIRPKWVLMTASHSFRNVWQSGIEYNKKELVYYKGAVWNCIEGHVSTQFTQDRSNWEIFALHIDYHGDWESSSEYVDGSVVKYNGIVYKCVEAHQSQSRLEDDVDKWNEFFVGIEYRGDWEPNKEFRKNDIVKFGASVYRCIETHQSVASSVETDPITGVEIPVIGFDSEKFEIEFPGFQYESDWEPTEKYQKGDVVRNGGTLFLAIKENVNINPSSPENDSTTVWEKFADFFRFRGKFELELDYKTGDVIQIGGQLFVAIKNIEANDVENSVSNNGDPSAWRLLISGSAFSRDWEEERFYEIGEVVYFRGTAYRCNTRHEASAENFPGDNGNSFNFWDIFLEGLSQGGLKVRGDLLTFGLSRTLADDGSTLGDTRVPIGNTEEFLSVSLEDEELSIFWRNRIQNSKVIFVGRNGVDDTEFDVNRGLVKEKPFRTIKFAAEYVEDNFEPGELVSIKAATGTFEEIAPIIVPAGCAILGQELRSTTVKANRPIPEYQDDLQFVENYLTHLTTFIFDLLQNNPVQSSPGNDIQQKFNTTTTDIDGVNTVLNQIDNFVNYVKFRILDEQTIQEEGITDPELVGSNDPSTDIAATQAGQALFENRTFIATELWAFIQNQNPNRIFTKSRVIGDVLALIRGVTKDLQFESNYYTLLAAERYVNAVLGSQSGDLFRMRDTTGLRLFTVTGLEGELIPVTAERRYPLVTGGAFVALDPGWGPEDERTWIINRSPYIQNITTIGTGCVGKRVDGRLHNGGNRSMVSNDFTQVLSDGIGAYASHGGRTELVSVFTYYNAVGYLAEEGGIIRATNGNNSYGTFGTVASGVDPEEVPATAQVFNRNNQAQVDEAISGGPVDEIIAFEYANAGQNYTTAEAEVIGAGDFVELEFTDFRDDACFESRIVSSGDSGLPGGSGYLTTQGFAQVTENATSTIRLSATDQTQLDTTYIGQRIIIIGGRGTGQYARISAYNPETRDATVRRESDGALGWDHIISGTPILPDIDSTARYRIEPRVDTTHPGFSNTTANLPAGRTVVASTYGETTEIFNNIVLGQGTGSTNDTPFQPAIVDITKNGRQYEVSIVDGGTGYAVGDTFVIPGTSLNGSSPENDLFIDILEVTEDSTNSILQISTEGTGKKGRIVALAEPNLTLYSENGTTWLQGVLSFVGDYKSIVAGNNNFIAISSNEDRVGFSLDGVTWESKSLPETRSWSDGAFGNGKFVVISEDSDEVVYSINGEDWNLTTIPDSTTTSFTKVAYGRGRFVAVSVNDKASATSVDGINWTRHELALPEAEFSTDEFAGFAFGDNKFVLLNQDGRVYYSFNGIDWLEGTDAPNSENIEWIDFKYAQGVFFAVGNDVNIAETNFVATTENGLLWREETLTISQVWTNVAAASFDDTPRWYIFADNITNNGVAVARTGKKAFFRASVFQRSIDLMKIIDPGSGYTSENPLEITVVDSQFTVGVQLENRIGSGVLSQPDFVNRGVGYVRGSSAINITGDGFADIIPTDRSVTLIGVEIVPRVGAQLLFDGIFDEDNGGEIKIFPVTRAVDLGDDGTRQGTRIVSVDLGNVIGINSNLEHLTAATIRTKVSQARITFHDFLDIGTGNFNETNYPEIYAGGNFFVASPENEVVEIGGGRVFYVSTDQDGNFRGGELFAVEQATGIVTISAEFFDLGGLSELSLGGVRLGGSGTVVREFSTDPTFTQDSDNVVSTQRAIATFLADRLSVGGENVETNELTSGRVRIGGEGNVIETITGEPVNFTATVIHEGISESGAESGVGGTMISQQLFLRRIDDNESMQ